MSDVTSRLDRYAVLYQDRLRRWVRRRLRGDADAEDIAQEAWLRAAPVLARDRIDNVQGYLVRVASNLIVDRVREERRRSWIIAPEAEALDVAAPEPSAESNLIEQSRMDMLARLVDDLPPRCREVFLLRQSEGLASKDIAERIGIGRNMVDKHLRHALLTIAAQLGEVEE